MELAKVCQLSEIFLEDDRTEAEDTNSGNSAPFFCAVCSVHYVLRLIDETAVEAA